MPGLEQVRAAVRRHRRLLAAGCTGLAVLLALTLLRAPGQADASVGSPAAAPGEVAMPVALTSAAHARTLHVGDVIDLVAVPRSGGGLTAVTGSAHVIAHEATVLSVPAGGFGAADGGVIVIAASRAEALAVADASMRFDFSAWITRAMPGDDQSGR